MFLNIRTHFCIYYILENQAHMWHEYWNYVKTSLNWHEYSNKTRNINKLTNALNKPYLWYE